MDVIFSCWGFCFQLMQAEMDSMSVELQRRDSSINIINAEKERLSTQLREEEREFLLRGGLVMYISKFQKQLQQQMHHCTV